jgi:hypothetical protein
MSQFSHDTLNLIPNNLLGNAKALRDLYPAQLVLIAVITSNRYINFMVNLIAKIFPGLAQPEHIIVSTWDEALAVIAKKRGQQTSY